MGLPNALKDDPLGTYIATHHIILAHAAAAKLYKEKYQVNIIIDLHQLYHSFIYMYLLCNIYSLINSLLQKSQGGKIGISLPCKWYMPHASADPKDFVATKTQLDFTLGW